MNGSALLRGALCSAALCLLLACSPSAKNEQQYWENHNKSVAEYSARWPAYKGLLEARQVKAKPLWDEATKVTDEKQKAEKMKAANEALHGGLMSKLEEIKYKSKHLEETTSKMNALRLTKSKDALRDAAVSNARTTLRDVESALSARPNSDDEAVAFLSDQVSKLISANGNADRSLKALKGK